MGGALGQSHPWFAPEGRGGSNQEWRIAARAVWSSMGSYTHTCKHTCEHIMYKQSEVRTIEAVDKARTTDPASMGWLLTHMLTHTLNTSSKRVEQAVYSLLPARRTI